VSTPAVTRADFRQLADVRLDEAKTLLDQGKWDGAYYLAGYAVECGLKACVIKRLMATDAFPDKDFSRNCYTHDLTALVKLAGLESAANTAKAADPVLTFKWLVVLRWSEQTRYHRIAEAEARELYDAVADPNHGVLSWIRTHW
jgi:hypothetical protein